MSLSELAASMKQQLEALLNSEMFSTDSIEGWICILLLGFIVWNLGRKAMKFVGWSVSVIFLFQVMHWLSLTSLNDIVPLSTYFKYDVMTSIAQCFVGTRACDLILTANGWIKAITMQTWEFLSGGGIQDAFRSIVP